jgi:hypothetical protein
MKKLELITSLIKVIIAMFGIGITYYIFILIVNDLLFGEVTSGLILLMFVFLLLVLMFGIFLMIIDLMIIDEVIKEARMRK